MPQVNVKQKSHPCARVDAVRFRPGVRVIEDGFSALKIIILPTGNRL